jgi:hypothetical protein
MITLFTSPKPFRGHIGVIQENAFRSWAKLGCDVIVFGDSEGGAELCRELGFRHVPDVRSNEFGTPLISALWSDAERLARCDTLCYVNADILLMSDFITACRELGRRRAMMIGRRWDLEVTEKLAFDGDWQAALRRDVAARGSLHETGGVDYFAFGRGVLGELPPMALGRGTWDMWLIYRARERGAAVIDATDVVMAVHQNHDYGKFKDQLSVSMSPEGLRNAELAGGPHHVWDPRDATHNLTKRGLVRRSVPLRRRVRKLAVLYPRLLWPVGAALRLMGRAK